jgi:hypothetical protein
LNSHIVPEPIVSREGWTDPEQEALLADSVGLALLVVLRADSAAVRAGASAEVRGAAAVADTFKGRAAAAQLALVNGAVGACCLGQLGQDRLLIRQDLIQLLLIPEDLVQLRLIRLDPLLIGEDLSLVGHDLFLVGHRCCICHHTPPVETPIQQSARFIRPAWT